MCIIKLRVRSIGVVMLILMTILLSGCQGYRYTKITQADDVPEKVTQALSVRELERGVYFFSSSFTDGSAYIVVCGGREFIKGYDVDIIDFTYSPLTFDSTPENHPVNGFFVAKFEERATEQRPPYCSDSVYPYVIYRVDGHGGEQEWLIVSESEDLPINHWWGLGAKQLETKTGICEVIECEDGIPSYLMQMYGGSLSTRGDCAELSPSYTSSDSNTTCIVISGQEDEPPFDVTLEAIRWMPRPHFSAIDLNQCDIVVRKRYGQESPFYNGDTPYSIIQIHSNKYKHIGVRSVLLIDDNLEWKEH